MRSTNIWELAKDFPPITLEEMEKVRLMNRIDTKYTVHPECLYLLLEQMQGNYLIQEIQGKRICRYKTVYLDTQRLDMYLVHQNGHKNREKIRMRTYMESDLTFLEIKDKNNKGRTHKTRMRISSCRLSQNEGTGDFLRRNARYRIEELIPQLENQFERITLVNKDMTERLTIDTNIAFHNLRTNICQQVPELAIIELKQDGNRPSPAKNLLSAFHIHPASISKYCLGSILTNPEIKYNRFKIKLIKINKLTHSNYGLTS